MANPTAADLRALQEQGYSKTQIAQMYGGASNLSAHDLAVLGFSESKILDLKGHLPKIGYDAAAGKAYSPSSGGGGLPAVDPSGEFGLDPLAPNTNTEGAFQMFASILGSWGIPMGGDIESLIRAAMVDGYTPDDMELLIPDIQNTQTWKNRFPGWQQRVSNGYNQISVGEYLALESSYHRILQSAGLPSGFYDDPSDFGNWIANNVSPDELNSRVKDAMDLVRQVDPTARNLLTQFYGVGAGDLAAYFLDPQRALPTLDRQYKSVNVAGWAVRNGLTLADAKHYEDLVDKGVSPDMAAQGYGTIGQFSRVLGNLGDIHGIRYSQFDAENDVFFNQDEKRKRIVDAERAAFSGSSGFRAGVSGRGSTAGSY